MLIKKINLPSVFEIKQHIISSLKQYWFCNPHVIASLPIQSVDLDSKIKIPLSLKPIKLPIWARRYGVDGFILVPEELIPFGASIKENNLWKKIDWFLVSFLFLESWHERVLEISKGPIHSYSNRLKGWDDRVWKHAWVNRIALFLRAWGSRLEKIDQDLLFGKLPNTKILMTHDVDAVKKTFSIRVKQSMFILFTGLFSFLHGKFYLSSQRIFSAIKFLFGNENWWKFDELLFVEKKAKINSIFNFYSDERHKTFKSWLFDPSYKVKNKQIKKLIKKLIKNNHKIGLHPSFDSWKSEKLISQQKKLLEKTCKTKVENCRQHWLRFSWENTWFSQEMAGLKFDTTLMFNNRSGFRNSSAIAWKPWNQSKQTEYNLKALPTVLMDSHLYDYDELNDFQRKKLIRSLLSECFFVHGEIAVLWHPHTLSNDYGWKKGFIDMLSIINEMKKI